jgi:hypothetical protein
MRIAFLMVLISLPSFLLAQNIAGLYKPVKKSGDPQGGAIFFITEDDHWGAMAFGTVKYGTIEILNDSLLIVGQLKPKSPFSIYGRHNSSIGDSTQIFMSDFADGLFLIHFGDTVNVPFAKNVFTRNANNFSYPYVTHFSGLKKSISLARQEGYEGEEFQFFNYYNSKGYNDFVIINHSVVYFQRDYIMMSTDSLIYKMGEKETAWKKVSDVNQEVKNMHQYVSGVINYPDTVFFSRQYKSIAKKDIEKEWRYQKDNDCYKKMSNENKVLNKSEPDFNHPSIVYPYILINDFKETNSRAKIQSKPLFSTSED